MLYIPHTHVYQCITCILSWNTSEFGFELCDPFQLDRRQLGAFKSLREGNGNGLPIAWVYLPEIKEVHWLRHPDFRRGTFKEFGV